MKRLLLVFVALVVLAVAGLGIAWQQFQSMVAAPQTTQLVDETIVVRRGLSVTQISERLKTSGALETPLIFQLHVRASGAAAKLKAGEYKLYQGESIKALVSRMVAGDVFQRSITVPEGLKSVEIVALLKADPMLSGEITDVPPDGALLPETYAYQRGDKRAEILGRMQKAHDDLVARLWPNRPEGLPLASMEDAVVLASIIEKETGVKAERGLVAGVFINRLNKGMKLQTDPTVVYGIELAKGAPMGRPLSRKDLATPTPYNTYVIEGLPPTPICNPGTASLAAALNPETTDYLYFVADGTGGHAFAKTLAGHNRNVAAWRKIERARKQR